MFKVMLDTDIFSEIFKGINQAVGSHALPYFRHWKSYTISSITVAEVIKGFQRRGQIAKIQAFLEWRSKLEILPFDFQAAMVAGNIYADLEKSGTPIGRCDPMIAAIAITCNLTLVTGNTKHYERIQNLGYLLTLENWKE